MARVGAVLGVAQAREAAHPRQAQLQGLARVQARQQRGRVVPQLPLEAADRLPQLIHLAASGLPGLIVGEQVVQVPGALDRDLGSGKAGGHAGCAGL